MRKIHKRVLIETREVSIFGRRKKNVRKYCDECGRDVTMLSPAEAASLISERTSRIYFLMKSKKIHQHGADGEKPLVCLLSLSLL